MKGMIDEKGKTNVAWVSVWHSATHLLNLVGVAQICLNVRHPSSKWEVDSELYNLPAPLPTTSKLGFTPVNLCDRSRELEWIPNPLHG